MKETGFRNRRILTVSLSGKQRYTLRKESMEEQWLRQSRTIKAFGLPWIPFQTVSRGEVRQFAGRGYRCMHAHLTMPGYEPDRTPVLWEALD